MRNNLLRGRWKPWTWSTRTWIMAIGLTFLISPLATRWICLWRIPDVVLPFEVEDVIRSEVPEEEDAFVVYGRVMKMLASHQATAVNQEPNNSANPSLLSGGEIAQLMSLHDEKSLAEYLHAGEMARACGPSLRTATYSTKLGLHQELRQLARTYNALGIAFDQAGDIEKAWACHRANLQCSIHAEQPGFAVCALIATALRSISAEGISQWAADPSIDAVRLRAARMDVVREFARRISLIDVAKAEYLSMRNTLQTAEGVTSQLPTPAGTPSDATPLLFGKRIVLYCLGQPDLTLRLARQILLNNETELDKPAHLRRHSILVKSHGQILFDRDPAARAVSGQLHAEELVRILSDNSPMSRVQNALLVHFANMDEGRLRENARLATLTVLFAAQEYHRVHGQFPETLEQLIPSFLEEVPFDPLGADGVAVKYRRDADRTAIVWSVGSNRIDDQGTFDKLLDIGFHIHLNETEDSK